MDSFFWVAITWGDIYGPIACTFFRVLKFGKLPFHEDAAASVDLAQNASLQIAAQRGFSHPGIKQNVEEFATSYHADLHPVDQHDRLPAGFKVLETDLVTADQAILEQLAEFLDLRSVGNPFIPAAAQGDSVHPKLGETACRQTVRGDSHLHAFGCTVPDGAFELRYVQGSYVDSFSQILVLPYSIQTHARAANQGLGRGILGVYRPGEGAHG